MGPFPTTKKFINRQLEIKHAEEVLDQVKSLRSPAVRGVIYFGIPGIGKSRILQSIKSRCQRQKFLPAWIDFQSLNLRSYLDYLLQISAQLEQGQKHARFRETFLGAEQIPKDDEQVLRVFSHDVKQQLKAQPLILLHDSCEFCAPELFDWIGQRFLLHLLNSGVGPIALFLASRGPQVEESNWPPIYRDATQKRHVLAFDFVSTKRHIIVIDKAKQYSGGEKPIYELSAGHPFSTEALIYFLQSLNINTQAIPQHRPQLAQLLYDEIIRKQLLPPAELWPRESFEIACIPRRFDAALLEKLAPDYTHYWYTTRMQELQKSRVHLIQVGPGKPGYQLETTLRRLLHIAVSILQAERVAAINRQLKQIYENELRRETSRGRPNAVSLLEMLYHHIQVEILAGQQPLASTEELLRAKLKAHFNPAQRDDLVELNQLRDLLDKDFDFIEILGKPANNRLMRIVDHFIKSPQQREICHLSIRHTPPSEYQVSWFIQNKPLNPAQTVHSYVKHSIAKWRQDPEQRGRVAYTTYLPLEVQEFLKTNRRQAILLNTDTMDIPFELMHDDQEFLCLSRPFGRQIEMMEAAKEVAPIAESGWRALVVGDPTGDLRYANEEAEAVADLLEQANVTVDRSIGRATATVNNFVESLVLHQYHLIHYAGHGFFNRSSPTLSGLRFGRKAVVTAEEFQRYLKSPAFVFFSACEAAAAGPATMQFNAQGRFIQNLAIGALQGGACGCLGPMWTIEDRAAKDFSVAFYNFLLQGKSTGEAVRLARKKLRHRSTDCWAAWVLFGNPYTHPLGTAPM